MGRKLAKRCGVLAAFLVGSAVHANDKPMVAPPEVWVTPKALPAADGKSDGRAVRMLLQDQQVRMAPDAISVYVELAMRIQTPEGLAAGNISLPWTPDMDTLTVHKLHVVRAGKVIDVLASGQDFVVLRRETSLETATLDGVLTANIQPAGLEVGDVIDLALTIRHVDPVLKGHAETGLALAAPADLATLKVQWPEAMAVRWRATDDMARPQLTRASGVVTVSTSLAAATPVMLPRGAPWRFALSRTIEFTDFQDWSDLARLMAPLFDTAATLPTEGVVRTEVARIAALSPDPKLRAQAALRLVQDQVRYVALALNAGRLVPADAETSWSRRFGDCKGKTALLLALLRPLGIEAEAVLVNATGGGDGIDQRLPMLGLFNHVLVRARIGGRTYWLDGTRTGDLRIDDIATPPFEWGLPLIASGAGLVRIKPAPFDRPQSETTISLDASAGLTLPAKAHVEQRFRGDGSTMMRHALDNLTGDSRDSALRQYWRDRYNFITPTVVSARYEETTSEEVLTVDGTAKMDWSDGRYETDGMSLGYAADFTREAGPHADAPFAITYPRYAVFRETIVLPNKGAGFALDAPAFDRTLGGVTYHRAGSLKDGIVTLEKSERAVVSEISFAEAAAAQEPLRALGRKALFVRPPIRQEFKLSDAVRPDGPTPTTLGGLMARADARLEAQAYPGAVADYSSALALDPNNSEALGKRAIGYAWLGKAELAGKDAAAALVIDKRAVFALRARGLVALLQDRPHDAVADFTAALAVVPGDGFTLGHRAEAQHAAGDEAAALADSAAALRIMPRWPTLSLLRANIRLKQGQPEAVVAEIKSMLAANPDNDYAHIAAGAGYAKLGRDADAQAEFARAIAIRPSVSVYLTRMAQRAIADLAGRTADVQAALLIDPNNVEARSAAASLKDRAGDHDGAVRDLSVVLKTEPDNQDALLRRGIAYARAGNLGLAEKDYAAARGSSPSAALLNDMCWAQATENVSLAGALANCDAALALDPADAAALDSRAFVLLRLGRVAEAIIAYDKALKIAPAQGASLYGRALAEARQGDPARAESDRLAAMKSDPQIARRFAGYGLNPDIGADSTHANSPSRVSNRAPEHR